MDDIVNGIRTSVRHLYIYPLVKVRVISSRDRVMRVKARVRTKKHEKTSMSMFQP